MSLQQLEVHLKYSLKFMEWVALRQMLVVSASHPANVLHIYALLSILGGSNA